MSPAFACHVYPYSVILISLVARHHTRFATGQSPGEDTARNPRTAPRAIPAVVVRFT